MRFFEFESRQIVAKAGIPVSGHGFAKTPAEARKIAEDLGAPDGHQIAGPDRRADEGRRRQVRRHARRGGASRGGHPRARDQRPHAARRARRLPRRGRPGVLRRRHLGRHAQAAGPDLQRHGRDRHRGGRRDPPRPRRARPLLDPAAVRRLRGQAGHRLRRRHRPRADAPDADPLPARAAVPPVRHDAGRDQPARAARGRHVRRRRRPHGHGERGAAAPEGDPEGARRRRRGDAPGPRGDAVRARRRGRRPAGPPRRGRQRDRVRRRPRARDRRRRRLADAVRRGPRPRRQARQLLRDRRQPVGREGLRPGQARAPEAGRGQDRGDDVDRLQHAGRHRRPRRDQGLRGARLRPGGEDLDLPHPRGVGGRRLQDPRALRRPATRTAASR